MSSINRFDSIPTRQYNTCHVLHSNSIRGYHPPNAGKVTNTASATPTKPAKTCPSRSHQPVRPQTAADPQTAPTAGPNAFALRAACYRWSGRNPVPRLRAASLAGCRLYLTDPLLLWVLGSRIGLDTTQGDCRTGGSSYGVSDTSPARREPKESGMNQ